MNFKRSLLAFCLIMCILFCISSVAATDANDMVTASDDIKANEEISTVNNEISDDELAVEENNDDVVAIDEKDMTAKASDDDSVLTVTNDEQALAGGAEKVKVTVYKQTGDYATNKKLYFKATDSSNNPVEVSDKSLKIVCTVGGKTYNILASTNANGEGSFNWPDSKMTGGGTFTMKLYVESIFDGCEVGYDPTTVKVSIKPKTTNQAATTKSTKQSFTIAAKKLTATYKSGKKFNVKVTNSKTKKPLKGVNVIIKVDNKKAFILKTNKNGVVSFSTKNLKVGNHKVKIAIKKTKTYNAKTKTVAIKIVKKSSNSNTPKTKLRTTLTVNNGYRVDYKQYYFKVTLKDSQGHKLANKYIKIATYISMGDIDGMTVYHYATTNSNGVAEGYISPMINGAVTYDATFSFEGDGSYYSSSATKYIG